MKPFRRWLFNLAVGVSGLLLVLMAASGLSFVPRLNVVWGDGENRTGYAIGLYHGQLGFKTRSRMNKLSQTPFSSNLRPGEVDKGFDFIGIHYHRVSAFAYPNPSTMPGAFVQNSFLPSEPWPIILFSILPIVWLIHWVRNRGKTLPGHCRVCGYDLRATPDRCPECGTISSAAKGGTT